MCKSVCVCERVWGWITDSDSSALSRSPPAELSCLFLRCYRLRGYKLKRKKSRTDKGRDSVCPWSVWVLGKYKPSHPYLIFECVVGWNTLCLFCECVYVGTEGSLLCLVSCGRWIIRSYAFLAFCPHYNDSAYWTGVSVNKRETERAKHVCIWGWLPKHTTIMYFNPQVTKPS